MAAATITPFPFGELAKFLEMAAQAFTEVGELIMKSAEAWAVGFVELITGLVNFEPWLVLTGMIDMFFATVGFALGVFVLVPLLEFAVVLELAILSIGWIISNIFGAIPVLAGPLLGALAAAVVPGVAGVTGLAGLAAVPAVVRLLARRRRWWAVWRRCRVVWCRRRRGWCRRWSRLPRARRCRCWLLIGVLGRWGLLGRLARSRLGSRRG